MKKTNADYVRDWYYKQKTKGIIYRVFVDGDTDCYIGATFNSLQKRLYQHRAKSSTRTAVLVERHGKDAIQIEPLWESKKRIDRAVLRELEQAWIEWCSPTLNRQCAIAQDKKKRCYKGGVVFNNTWYPTKRALWEAEGNCPYNTFKTRLHHGKSLEQALK